MPQRLDFDFAAFYKALRATVAVRDISWKAVSEQTGVSQSTLSRMSKGRQPDAASLTAISAWSGINPVDFTTAPQNDPEAVATVSRLLRADPNLDENGAGRARGHHHDSLRTAQAAVVESLVLPVTVGLTRCRCGNSQVGSQLLPLPDLLGDFRDGLLHNAT